MTAENIIEQLIANGVDFVVVGGMAAASHGASRPTFDLDICYARNRANLERLVDTIAPWHPRLRGAPEGLPFLWDSETLQRGLNFTLKTDLGDLDLLGEVSGVGSYEQARKGALVTKALGVECAVISLPALISAKRAAGRAKDKEALLELEALWEAQQPDEPTD